MLMIVHFGSRAHLVLDRVGLLVGDACNLILLSFTIVSVDWPGAEGRRLYLEATSPHNRRLYLRHGFQ